MNETPRRTPLVAAVAALVLLWPALTVFPVARRTAASLRPVRVAPVSGAAALGLTPITFRARDGVALAGVQRPPDNGVVIVFAHGWGANRDQMWPQAEALAHHGYGLLLFDARAHGESGGERTTWGALEGGDVLAALDVACPRDAARRCGGVGFSMGGLAMVQAAALDTRLAAVVLEGTPRSLEDMFAHDERAHGALGGWVALATLRWLAVPPLSPRPIEAVAAIAPRPLLLVYGDRDDAISPGTGEALLAAAREPKRLHHLRGATHATYATAAGGDLGELLAAFFAPLTHPVRG